MFELFSLAILAPGLVGFDLNDKEVKRRLPEVTSKLLLQLKSKLHPESLAKMVCNLLASLSLSHSSLSFLFSQSRSFGETLKRARMDFSMATFDVKDLDVEFYTTLSRGYMQLHETGLLDTIFKEAKWDRVR